MDTGITGIGIVSPPGIGRDNFTEAIYSGRCSFTPVDKNGFRFAPIENIPLEEYFEAGEFRRHGNLSKFALLAARLALSEAGYNDSVPEPERTGLFFACTHGVINYSEKFLNKLLTRPRLASPMYFSNSVYNIPAGHISIAHKMTGPSYTLVGKNLTALRAFTLARGMIENGLIDKAVVAAGNELGSVLLNAYRDCGKLSPLDGGEPGCRPYDQKHNGLLLGEGACALVLEKGKKGFGSITSVSEERIFEGPERGAGKLAQCIKEVLRKESLDGGDLCFVSGCSDGVPERDDYEMEEIQTGLDGKKAVVRNLKSNMGELFAASGLFRIAEALIILGRGEVPRQCGFERPSITCDLDFPGINRVRKGESALLTFMDYGEQTAAAVVKR